MKTNKLYIIGNGFDLHHSLKTSYYNFAEYLRDKNKQLYENLESYVSYPSSDKYLWSKFEENLANLDVEEIMSEYADTLPDYASDEFRDRDRHVFPDIMDEFHTRLTSGLIEIFQQFIQDVEVGKTAFYFKVELDNSAIFLTFNYTNTLEYIYNIGRERIIYIHNSAFNGNESVILGHGVDPKSFEEERLLPPDNLNADELEYWYQMNDNWDYSYDTGKENLMKYFKDTFKPTKDIIQRHDSFFRNSISISEVYILGHSISKVDHPYIETIIKSVRQDAKWIVSYYDSKEKNTHLETLAILGLNKSNITLIKLEDIQVNNKQLKIDFGKY